MQIRIIIAGLLLMTTNASPQAGVRLADLTWQEAAQSLPEKIVILPFAAGAKEHGPHLPLGTDALVMEHLIDAAVAERDVVVVPPILHGWFPAFRDYPGTEISDPTVFQRYVKGVSESLIRHGARRLVLLNTGITRATGLPLAIVARDLRADHDVRTLLVSWDDLESPETEALYQQLRGGHADEGETSILLFLRPDLVRQDLMAAEYRQERAPQIGYAPGKFDRAAEDGHFGDPTLASAEKGEALLAIMVSRWLQALDQFEAGH